MKLRTRLRLWLGLLLLALMAAGLLIMFSQQPGYVLISFDSFRYESSLWFFLALLAGLWLILWLLRLSIRALLITSGWLNPWSSRARTRRALRAEQRGLLAFAEGRFDSALPYLKKAASGGEALLPLLAAARAAQQLGDSAQAQALLEQAKQQNPQRSLAIDLVQAELQYQRGEWADACQTLQSLHQHYPNHRQVLRQLQPILEQQQDWLALQSLLPKLQKHGLLSEEQRLVFEQQAACLRLKQAVQSQESEPARMALDSTWRELPKSLREQASVLITYAKHLAQLGASDEAEQRLSKAIKRHYDSRLAACYGKLQTSDPEYQLKTAESWLKNQPEDGALLLALARLSRASGLFGKARSYYEASLSQQGSAETRAELAQLLLEMGETQQSAALLEQALNGLNADTPSLAKARLTLQKST